MEEDTNLENAIKGLTNGAKKAATNNPIANFLIAKIKFGAFIIVGSTLLIIIAIGLVSALVRWTLELSGFENAVESSKKYIGVTNGVKGSSSSIKSGSKVEQAIAAAETMVGGNYVWGAEDPDSRTFDCSGLTKWVYAQVGIEISHQSESQRDEADVVKPVEEAVPGDILWRSGHVGLYIGDGQVIEASSPSVGIIRDDTSGFTHALHWNAMDA